MELLNKSIPPSLQLEDERYEESHMVQRISSVEFPWLEIWIQSTRSKNTGRRSTLIRCMYDLENDVEGNRTHTRIRRVESPWDVTLFLSHAALMLARKVNFRPRTWSHFTDNISYRNSPAAMETTISRASHYMHSDYYCVSDRNRNLIYNEHREIVTSSFLQIQQETFNLMLQMSYRQGAGLVGVY